MPAETRTTKRSVYHREIPAQCPGCGHRFPAFLDVYMVLHAFAVTSQTIGHAIKKLLVPGQRSGGKTEEQDVSEAVWTLHRWQEMRSAEKPDGK